MDIPWSRMSLNRTHPSMDLADPEFNETSGLKIALTFNPAQAEKLFAASGHTFAEIADAGQRSQGDAALSISAFRLKATQR